MPNKLITEKIKATYFGKISHFIRKFVMLLFQFKVFNTQFTMFTLQLIMLVCQTSMLPEDISNMYNCTLCRKTKHPGHFVP